MKSVSFRVHLMLIFWLVVLVSLCLPAVIFHGQLQRAILQDVEQQIQKDLKFLLWSLRQQTLPSKPEALDRWTAEIGKHLGVRITYIASGGRVIADSDVPFERLGSLDNHWQRPEVQAARGSGYGMSVRKSNTLQLDLMYAAMPISGVAGIAEGILRVAMPMSSIKEKLEQQYRGFWMLVLVTLCGTGLFSYLVSRWLEAPLNRLIETATAIGRGHYDQRVQTDTIPELRRLAKTINEMAAGISGHIRDVASEKAQLETILESMKEGVLVLDGQGRILRSNHSMDLIQKDPRVSPGWKILEVFLNTDLQDACNRVLGGEARVRLELKLARDRFYDINIVRLATDRGATGAVLAFHDITELRRLARVRRDFVANVSHELRTPLTAIKGYAETLLAGPCAETRDGQAFIRIILKKADHMSRMVNDLLLLTRLESEEPEDMKAAVDAREALESAMETCHPSAAENSVTLVPDLPERPIFVQAIEDRLEEVFQNLLDNAIRYSPPNTSVRVFSRTEPSRTVFGVEDQGPGIPPEHRERIFERFYRLDRQRESKSGSTGLGLAICRHILENLGGKIWVESPPPDRIRGSIFYFWLRNAAKPPDKLV